MLTTEALISELQEDEKSPGDVRRFGHVIPFAKYRNCPQPGGKPIRVEKTPEKRYRRVGPDYLPDVPRAFAGLGISSAAPNHRLTKPTKGRRTNEATNMYAPARDCSSGGIIYRFRTTET